MYTLLKPGPLSLPVDFKHYLVISCRMILFSICFEEIHLRKPPPSFYSCENVFAFLYFWRNESVQSRLFYCCELSPCYCLCPLWFWLQDIRINHLVAPLRQLLICVFLALGYSLLLINLTLKTLSYLHFLVLHHHLNNVLHYWILHCLNLFYHFFHFLNFLSLLLCQFFLPCFSTHFHTYNPLTLDRREKI